MSHSRQLIESIAAKVAIDYPLDAGYEYVFEKSIRGTRMMPDILVQRGGKHVCAVEIGYTRPEKLTAYRTTLRIPDVRWYDKAGNLHGDVDERVVTVSVTTRPQGDLFVYHAPNRIPCQGCEAVYPSAVPGHAADRYIRRFGGKAYDTRNEEAWSQELVDVETMVITDYVQIWLPSFCDKCGRTWFATAGYGIDDGDDMVDLFRSHRPVEIGQELGRRASMTWEAVAESVAERFNLKLEYPDGLWIDEDDKPRFHRHIHVAGVAARKAAP